MGERTRANQINFRLTEAELQQFQKNLKRSKLKQSEYLRKCVLEIDVYRGEGCLDFKGRWVIDFNRGYCWLANEQY